MVRSLSLPFVLFASAACGGGSAEGSQGGRGGPGGRGDPDRIVPVEIAIAELGTAARTLTATGAVEPIRTVGINAQLAGALTSVQVQEGDRVASGTVLARIDSREIQAQLASAEASLEVARRAAERSAQLAEQQIITAVELERDQAALAAAQATRDQLRTRLGFATIRSPIAGVVLEKRVERGDVVSSQTRLFSIGDISTLVVRVPVSELEVTGLAEGEPVDMAFDAHPGQLMSGRIRRVFPSADSVTRLVPVEIALDPATARRVRPGFLARVTFRLEPRTGVLLVPAGALVESQTGAALFIVTGGEAHRRPVRRGETYQGKVEITSGIAPGDTVIVAGSATVRDGARVRIVEPPRLDAPARGRIGNGGAPAGAR